MSSARQPRRAAENRDGANLDGAITGERPQRTDARRNRDHLIAVARSIFATADDTVSLESIARAAGLGIGTLYRHFPTREALVEAVYTAELDDVVAGAHVALDRLPADLALRDWLDRYAAFSTTKHGMIDTLRAGWASGRIATSSTRERVTGAVATILAAGAQSGTLRDDVQPDDVTAMLLGVFLSTAAGGFSDQTARLLDLMVDGLRPRHQG